LSSHSESNAGRNLFVTEHFARRQRRHSVFSAADAFRRYRTLYIYNHAGRVIPGIHQQRRQRQLADHGTPTHAGTILFTVNVSDSAAHTSSVNFTITINKGTPTITWSNPVTSPIRRL